MRAIVRTVAETQVEVIVADFERVGHLQILQRPASKLILQIFRSILQPNPDIPFRLFTNLKWENISAVQFSRMPLDTGKASNPREHSCELIGLLPCHIEGADAARRSAGNGPAVAVFADVVSLVNLLQNLV